MTPKEFVDKQYGQLHGAFTIVEGPGAGDTIDNCGYRAGLIEAIKLYEDLPRARMPMDVEDFPEGVARDWFIAFCKWNGRREKFLEGSDERI